MKLEDTFITFMSAPYLCKNFETFIYFKKFPLLCRQFFSFVTSKQTIFFSQVQLASNFFTKKVTPPSPIKK